MLHLQAGSPDRVVILVNSEVPDSMRIAKHYAAARSIPEANIIELAMSTKETISLQEYVATIHNPLLEALLNREWILGVRASQKDAFGRTRLSVAITKLDYLVTTSGVPLRFENDLSLLEADLGELPKQFHHNRASVDSELALLAGPPGISMTSFIQSPLFGQVRPKSPDAARVLRVSRLDGPSVESVIRLVNRSIEAETKGLYGRAYIDIGGPHKRGDEWFEVTAKMARQMHFDTDVEATKQLIDDRHRLDAPAIYMGWYRANAISPWSRPQWGVPPGAIAYHLHSFSATTVRSPKKRWLGPFVHQGYSATVGSVFEPYLDLTHRPDAFLGRLLDGASFGEAVAFSNPGLSWQTVAIGDPLYRPFKQSLEAQLKLGPEGPFASYVAIREMNRLLEEEGIEAALAYGRVQFAEQPALALSYRLAELYLEAEDPVRAVESLKILRYLTTYQPDEVVLAKKAADLLHLNGAEGLALEIYQKLLALKKMPKQLRILLLESGAKVALDAGDVRLSTEWKMTATSLKPPPKKS
ncbi:MAG: TIGR03790 family protein [Verrucomicrobiota bacterium]